MTLKRASWICGFLFLLILIIPLVRIAFVQMILYTRLVRLTSGNFSCVVKWPNSKGAKILVGCSEQNVFPEPDLGEIHLKLSRDGIIMIQANIRITKDDSLGHLHQEGLLSFLVTNVDATNFKKGDLYLIEGTFVRRPDVEYSLWLSYLTPWREQFWPFRSSGKQKEVRSFKLQDSRTYN